MTAGLGLPRLFPALVLYVCLDQILADRAVVARLRRLRRATPLVMQLLSADRCDATGMSRGQAAAVSARPVVAAIEPSAGKNRRTILRNL